MYNPIVYEWDEFPSGEDIGHERLLDLANELTLILLEDEYLTENKKEIK